jgi:hypothetical protein
VSSRREWENPGRQREAEGGRWLAEVNAALVTELSTQPRKRVPTWIVMARVRVDWYGEESGATKRGVEALGRFN